MMYILTPRGFVTATVIQRFTVISDYVIYLLSSVMMLFDWILWLVVLVITIGWESTLRRYRPFCYRLSCRPIHNNRYEFVNNYILHVWSSNIHFRINRPFFYYIFLYAVSFNKSIMNGYILYILRFTCCIYLSCIFTLAMH